MRLSGHSYNNDVFNSLLDGLSDEVVLKKKASQEKQQHVSGMNIFSSTTHNDLDQIHDEQLRFIASELQYAADNAKVAINTNDLRQFASQVVGENLKGKALEKAARKYCSDLNRELASPQGDLRTDSLVDQLHSNTVLPAGYNPEYGPNNSRTGGYLGQSKNPNTIFDQDAIQQFAKKVTDYSQMTGDEKIAHSKSQMESYRQAMKDEPWQEKQKQLSDPNVIQSKSSSVQSSHTGNESGTSQCLPQNAMSIFSNDRDFENIPEKTVGETLKEAAKERSNKASAAKNEWNQVKPTQKADNSLSAIFAGDTHPMDQTTSTQRDAIDKIFESLIN